MTLPLTKGNFKNCAKTRSANMRCINQLPKKEKKELEREQTNTSTKSSQRIRQHRSN